MINDKRNEMNKEEYLWKSLRNSKYGGVEVVGFKEASPSSVLAGQTLTCFIGVYEDAEAALAAHPECVNWTNKWSGPQVSVSHLSDDDYPESADFDDHNDMPMDDPYREDDDSMDGDHASALASAGWGTDEDYGSAEDTY